MSKGLDRNLLQYLLTSNIENVEKLSDDKKNCIICLEDFKNREEIVTLPCTHIFHTKCIKDWLIEEKSCPICKFEITRESLGL